jgi:hypothetical protein
MSSAYGGKNWNSGRTGMNTAGTWGRRGFSVIALKDGTFQLLKYVVGQRETVERQIHRDTEMACRLGTMFVTPLQRWIDVTADCTFESRPVSGFDKHIIVVAHEGRTVTTSENEYSLEDGKVFKKKVYYDE